MQRDSDCRNLFLAASGLAQDLVCVLADRSIPAAFGTSPGGTPHAYAPGVPEATGTYEPRDPAQSVLFQVVRDHFETFRAQAASLRDG